MIGRQLGVCGVAPRTEPHVLSQGGRGMRLQMLFVTLVVDGESVMVDVGGSQVHVTRVAAATCRNLFNKDVGRVLLPHPM